MLRRRRWLRTIYAVALIAIRDAAVNLTLKIVREAATLIDEYRSFPFSTQKPASRYDDGGTYHVVANLIFLVTCLLVS